VAEDDVRGGDAEPAQDLADAVQAAAPQRAAGEVAVDRASPSALSAATAAT